MRPAPMAARARFAARPSLRRWSPGGCSPPAAWRPCGRRRSGAAALASFAGIAEITTDFQVLENFFRHGGIKSHRPHVVLSSDRQRTRRRSMKVKFLIATAALAAMTAAPASAQLLGGGGGGMLGGGLGGALGELGRAHV